MSKIFLEFYMSKIFSELFTLYIDNCYKIGLEGKVERALGTWLLLNQTICQQNGIYDNYVFPSKIFNINGLLKDIKYLNTNNLNINYNLFNRLELELFCKNAVYRSWCFNNRQMKLKFIKIKNKNSILQFSIKKGTGFFYLPNMFFHLNEKVLTKMKNLFIGNKNQFEEYLCCILIRYFSLMGNNLNAGVPEEVYQMIDDTYKVSIECFASPLNNTFKKFCSLFYDIEKPFGSIGSFFNQKNMSGFCVANPPFDETFMFMMAEKMIEFLKKSNPLTYFIVIPDWKSNKEYGKYRSYELLKSCKYFVLERHLKKHEIVFTNYSTYNRMNLSGAYIIVLQNSLGKNIHNVSSEIIDNIIKKWKNIKCSECEKEEQVNNQLILQKLKRCPDKNRVEKLKKESYTFSKSIQKYNGILNKVKAESLGYILGKLITFNNFQFNISVMKKNYGEDIINSSSYTYLRKNKSALMYKYVYLKSDNKNIESLTIVNEDSLIKELIIPINFDNIYELHKFSRYFSKNNILKNRVIHTYIFDVIKDLNSFAKRLLFVLINGVVGTMAFLRVPYNTNDNIFRLFDFARVYFEKCSIITHENMLFLLCERLRYISGTELLNFTKFVECISNTTCIYDVIESSVCHKISSYLDNNK